MALKPCKECDEMISTRAKICPHCGTQNPRQGTLSRILTPIFRLVFALIGVGAVLLFLYFLLAVFLGVFR